MPSLVHAENRATPGLAPVVAAPGTKPSTALEQPPSFKASVRAMLEREVKATGLPADIADAVVYVESNYDPTTIGGVGEIGLMQIRPQTAAMLGFKGSDDELARPEVNVHYGVIYLSRAWRLAEGDLCRALMKYRAGHGEEIMTPRSVTYCQRARNHLAALGSPFALGGTTPPLIASAVMAEPQSKVAKQAKLTPDSSTVVYAKFRRGTAAASRAFWAAREAHVRAVTVQLEAKWRRVASR